MIGEAAQDIVDKVKTVTAFGTAPIRVGLATGGKSIDPMMEKTPRPCAWVFFTGDANQSTSKQGICNPLIRTNFIVKIIVDYGTQDDLIDDVYPLLENVIRAVNGTPVPTGAPNLNGLKWLYVGETVEEVTATRLVFEQQYTVDGVL